MKTIEIAGWIHTRKESWQDEREFQFWSAQDMSSCGFVMLQPHTFTVDVNVDEAHLTNAEIAMLRAEQQRIRAEAQSKVTRLEERISQLLALEHKQ